MLQIGHTCPEKYSDALKHKQVPQLQGHVLIYIKREKAYEPLKSQERGVEPERFKVLIQILEVLDHSPPKDLLVNQDADHV